MLLKVCGYTAHKMKFSIKDFFIKCDQIRSFLRIWSHLLKKSLMENFIFCAVHISVWLMQFIQNLMENWILNLTENWVVNLKI